MFPTNLGRIGNCLLSNEEILLFRRIARGGKRIAFAPMAIVHHLIAPERVSKRWLYRRAYWQGRSNAVLEMNTGRNVHDRMIRKLAALSKETTKEGAREFDRRCVERKLFGYIYQIVQNSHDAENNLVDTIRSMRILRTLLRLLSSARFRRESVRRMRRNLNRR